MYATNRSRSSRSRDDCIVAHASTQEVQPIPTPIISDGMSRARLRVEIAPEGPNDDPVLHNEKGA